MTSVLRLHPDRFFPPDESVRSVARHLFAQVEKLPIISPHGHTDPAWFAADAPFEDATSLFLWPDHYVLRMLYSQGIGFDRLGIAPVDGKPATADRRAVWRLFAENYHLFRGTPSRTWLDHAFATVFGLEVRLERTTADLYYDTIGEALARPDFRPRALFKRFDIEVLATTESATDALVHHARIKSEWGGRVVTTFRPDGVVDPDAEGFTANVALLGELTKENTAAWKGYLQALANRRAFFRAHGATATDHGHPTPRTADLAANECQGLLDRALKGTLAAGEAELFRAQMLTEMALMSCEDGMAMQIHPGSWRNHNPALFAAYGRDRGADIPMRTSYVDTLKPLLDRIGSRTDLTIILFTLDESNYARELAPLAGHYPCLKLGPAWWFHDSPEGMMRFRRQTTETAGFYNTVGFNDDTRAFLSIPARHDLARRIDCAYLAELVVTHRLAESEAAEIAVDLAYNLPKKAYKL
ncbi:MAG: glucuronate isomerase [Alphaproteobacteria bacterium]|nr:glucuronate isomerase [Alphaproteobacteria bacterium]MDE2631349.1 glucuronate isomerase [Alphaproteobacteria bacterium]